MAARHGRSWRRRAGAGRGRFGEHAATTTAGLVAVTTLPWRRNRTAAVIGTVAGAGWLLMTLRFAVGRILPGPRTPAEIGRMLASSVLIPPAACFHRVRGTLNARFGRLREPRYVLPAADTSARLGDRPRDISDIPDEELGPRGEGGH